MFRESFLVHLKAPNMAARNSRSLLASLRWEVLGCTSRPTEQRNPLTQREKESPIHRLLCSPSEVHSGLQRLQPQVPPKEPLAETAEPSGEGGRLPVPALGHLPCGRSTSPDKFLG